MENPKSDIYRYGGIDLAVVRPSVLALFDGCSFRYFSFQNFDELREVLEKFGTRRVVVDAPLSLPKGDRKFRECERIFAGKGALPLTGGMRELAERGTELKRFLEALGIEVKESIAPVIRKTLPLSLLRYTGMPRTDDERDAALMAFVSFLDDWDACREVGKECKILIPENWIRKEVENQLRCLNKFRADPPGKIRKMAAFDVSYRGNTASGCGVLARVTRNGRDFDVIEVVRVKLHNSIPYVPGFLSAREFPVIRKLFGRFRFHPDLIVVNGVGINHLRAGLATVAGVKLSTPSIGVTKHLFCRNLVEEKDRIFLFKGFPAGIKLGKYYLSIGYRADLEILKKYGVSAVALMQIADRCSKR